MILSICIPTYNRAMYLERNIELLIKFIRKNHLEKLIEIIISNNNSNDNTESILRKYQNEDITILIFNQKFSLKIQENFIFVANKSSSKYFMWLGDDDYIEEKYLLKVLKILIENETQDGILCILPSNIPINTKGKILNSKIKKTLKNEIIDKGFKNCMENSYRACQMSGLVFHKKVINEYLKRKVNNLYPFIFFYCFSSLNGKTYSVVDCPVKVTHGEKKYWNYGKDGLINDIFDNYKKLTEISYYQRVVLEIYFLFIHKWRYLQYKYKIFYVYLELLKINNMTIITKIFLAPIILLGVFCKIKNRIREMIQFSDVSK
ncbi:glycosyltransferase family 2 protein [Fusobacterium sp. THCT13E1]